MLGVHYCKYCGEMIFAPKGIGCVVMSVPHCDFGVAMIMGDIDKGWIYEDYYFCSMNCCNQYYDAHKTELEKNKKKVLIKDRCFYN